MSHAGINPELGRIYFGQGHDLHASDRGGFCPFPHDDMKKVGHLSAIVDGQVVQIAMPMTFIEELIAIADRADETDRLLASQRFAAAQFKQSRMIHAAPSRPRQRFV